MKPKPREIKIIAVMLFILFALTSCIYGGIKSSFAQTQTNNSSASLVDQKETFNKNMVIDLTKAFNERNLSAIDKLVAKDIIEHRPGSGQGIEATKGFLLALQTAFPDFKTTLNQIMADGDKVIVFTNTTGTHKGPFVFAPGVQPTGKVLSFQTADLYRIEGGKIAEHQDVIEIMDMLQKMGAIQFTNPSVSQPTQSPMSITNTNITNTSIQQP
jgi:predicted ester cyclase